MTLSIKNSIYYEKIIFNCVCIICFLSVNAQDGDDGGQTSEGKWLIEANTCNAVLGTTGIYFSSSDGNSSYNIGLDGGYFIMDDLAIKAGLGYGGFSPDQGDSTNTLSYRLGGKYYDTNNVRPYRCFC